MNAIDIAACNKFFQKVNSKLVQVGIRVGINRSGVADIQLEPEVQVGTAGDISGCPP